MGETILIEEFHLTFHAPDDTDDAEVEELLRALNRRSLRRRLARRVRRLLRRYERLREVGVRLTK